MDACEAMKIVMPRIKNLDTENASRIIGYILMQDQGEKEMIRLALAPDAVLLSSVNQAKACLGLAFPNSLSNSNTLPLNSGIRPTAFPNSPRYGYFGGSLSPPPPISPNSNFGGNELSDELLSPSGRSDSLIFQLSEDGGVGGSPHPHSHHPFHRRSYSVNDVFLSRVEEGGGVGCRPCTYLGKGFCRNGDYVGGGDELGSFQQQRFGVRAPFANYNKSSNSLNANQRCGPRNELSRVGMGMGMSAAMASSSRQIYLTFPADSTFKEEDVAGYFSMFGPVQDVRIPYQQKRMFGFVTFVYPDTVKHILAKGNPHYVCDSRVLVKPYMEKGKAPDKKQFQQQYQNLERSEYSPNLSPSTMDSKELFDVPIGEHAQLAAGPRMLFNRQEMLRRQLENEAELHNVIELQGRRMGNLQLMDVGYQQNNHRFLPSFPAGVLVSSPRQSQPVENMIVSCDRANPNVLQELDDWQESSKADYENSVLEETESSLDNNVSNGNRNRHVNDDDSYLPASLEHFLPGTLFCSPTKPASED
ncbi:zinc finger CCCH domain-containing protein 55-like [Salvia hispanica]|uniref:zinc finger CCCH domain-containing protein 55-like n=1 Tax=Salvia hispanica TaxID=49212 RepID=UPI002008F538|nr:zinc finger CCCH domain-containing protein 55-like [Salvia hispanica]